MTDEKICPFMSRPDNYEIRLLASTREEFERAAEAVKNVPFIPCIKDRCMAWKPLLTHSDTGEPILYGCRLIP